MSVNKLKWILIFLVLLNQWVFAQEIYKFSYEYQNESLSISHEADNFETAFKSAAKDCFHYFKKNKKVSENKGLDIIDVCANPKKG